ncbi:hypothetical protein MUK42_37292 [Musa troglodytarum]|uniref:Uncharacterized protein n=1 Tax=Musa troglodytarum TaxID=320322 RepID=A0A9E7JWB0_9LILI|nr:hypothetical protein MUK42_37292 [Musa troglodytarum]
MKWDFMPTDTGGIVEVLLHEIERETITSNLLIRHAKAEERIKLTPYPSPSNHPPTSYAPSTCDSRNLGSVPEG